MSDTATVPATRLRDRASHAAVAISAYQVVVISMRAHPVRWPVYPKHPRSTSARSAEMRGKRSRRTAPSYGERPPNTVRMLPLQCFAARTRVEVNVFTLSAQQCNTRPRTPASAQINICWRSTPRVSREGQAELHVKVETTGRAEHASGVCRSSPRAVSCLPHNGHVAKIANRNDVARGASRRS